MSILYYIYIYIYELRSQGPCNFFAPHLFIKLLEISSVSIFSFAFLRRATTRSYHFNHDKRRLDPYVIEWIDKRRSGNLTKRLRQAMMRDTSYLKLHHCNHVLNLSPAQTILSHSPSSIIIFFKITRFFFLFSPPNDILRSDNCIVQQFESVYMYVYVYMTCCINKWEEIQIVRGNIVTLSSALVAGFVR